MSLFFVLKTKLKRRQGWAFLMCLENQLSCPPKQAVKECDVVIMMEYAVMFGFSLKMFGFYAFVFSFSWHRVESSEQDFFAAL